MPSLPISPIPPLPILLLSSLAILSQQPATASVDDDGDGMSDVWERRYGATVLLPASDPDGDGISSLHECIAGTDPFSAGSAFAISGSQHLPRATLLQWDSHPGVLYQVELSIDGMTHWTEAGTKMSGNGNRLCAALPPNPAAQAFYRLRITTGSTFNFLPQDAAALLTPFDSDSDGHDDLTEILAGADPLDGSSSPPTLTLTSGRALSLQWTSESGKLYHLQTAPSYTGPWITHGGAHPGTGQLQSVSLPLDDGMMSLVRIQVTDTDSDGDTLTDWEEIQAGLNPLENITDTSQPPDADILRTMLAASNEICISTSSPVANLTRMEYGGFQIMRSGGIDELTVLYDITGTAIPGRDYVPLPGAVTIPFGQRSTVVPVIPLPESELALSESIIAVLVPSPAYTIGEKSIQQVNVLREVAINVADFGALGDGFTNDSHSIQAAITALEQSADHNTLHFPAGTYHLAKISYTPHDTGTSYYRVLELGNTDLHGRDLVIRGEPGTTLWSAVSPTRAKMLSVLGTFRSLRFDTLHWEKTSTPLSAVPSNKEPNGATGVSLVDIDNREIEAVTFTNCSFVNCHRSVTVDTSAFNNNGKLKRLVFHGCSFLNPYGSNTMDGATAYGGGQQVYVSSWVDSCEYLDNVFDGSGDDANETNNPGLVRKDGCHFGSPLQLVFKGNIVRRMAIEAVNQTNDHCKLGATKNSFWIPPPDGATARIANMVFDVSTLLAGQHVNIRAGGMNTVLRIISIDDVNDTLQLVNDGFPGNAAAGTQLAWNSPVYLQEVVPTEALILNNVFESAAKAVVANCHATIRGNLIYKGSIVIYDEYHTPLHPAGRGLRIDSNYLYCINPEPSTYYSYGIYTTGDEQHISNNRLFALRGTHYIGIRFGGADSLVLGNRVVAGEKITNGYASSHRALGIAVDSGASNARVSTNLTRAFDVGVGPTVPYNPVPYQVYDHTSIDDELAIDPVGLIRN